MYDLEKYPCKGCFSLYTHLAWKNAYKRRILKWWSNRDSNPGPLPCKGSALINWAITPYVVGICGLEPQTSSLSVTRSNQLSYIPKVKSTIVKLCLLILAKIIENVKGCRDIIFLWITNLTLVGCLAVFWLLWREVWWWYFIDRSQRALRMGCLLTKEWNCLALSL